MQTFRAAVSDIITDLKAYNLDDRYSYRFLANKLRDNIENFFRQDITDRGILKINELWKPLNNIRMKNAYSDSNHPLFDYPTDTVKSINKLPEVYSSKFGNLIKVVNLRGNLEYLQTKPFLYRDIQNREYASKKFKYFWIEDGYLYIPDSQVEEVKAYGLFKNSQEADLFNGIGDCCAKPLDAEILAPEYLVTIAKQQVIAALLQEKAIVEDTNPDLNPNAKN